MNEPTVAREMARESPGGPCDPGDSARTQRTRLFQSSLGLVERLRCHNVHRRSAPTDREGFSPDFQVCLPYRGLFVWHVGGDDVVSDANQVLFVSGGQAYRVSEPLRGGYAELIITPTPQLLVELLDIGGAELASHALFRRRRRRADPHLQLLRARFLHLAQSGDVDPLAAEELVVAILRSGLVADAPEREPGRSTGRLLRRTKEFVEWHLTEPLRLSDIARAVGVSPAYLTDTFRRFEGLPLHRYTLQLRLARSLIELPHVEDLTRLALDLGFSSHSHFAAAFHSAFACTPSAFRTSTRSQRRQRQTDWIAGAANGS